MAKGIHLEADSTTQEFKLYHGRDGLYIERAVANMSISNNSTNDSSRDNIGSSRDNIGSSRDNIGSSKNNIGSSNNISSSRNNNTSHRRRRTTNTCTTAEPDSTRSPPKRQIRRQLLLQLRRVSTVTRTPHLRRNLARTHRASKQHGIKQYDTSMSA
ncbi:unnamed protein product [Closterium sp. NIES-54]